MTISRRALCASALAIAVGGGIAPITSMETAQAATVARATGAVYVRSGASANSKPLGVLAKGQQVTLAGAAVGKWQPVSYRGQRGWVSSRYLSRTASRRVSSSVTSSPVAGNVRMPQGVTANGMAVANEVRANFPQIAEMGGRRNEAGSDHNTGRAVDIMLPNYRQNAALGQAIAEHMRANAERLGISYVIWNQHIWSVQRSREGWRAMADRGSDNANHKNHVHVSVN